MCGIYTEYKKLYFSCIIFKLVRFVACFLLARCCCAQKCERILKSRECDFPSRGLPDARRCTIFALHVPECSQSSASRHRVNTESSHGRVLRELPPTQLRNASLSARLLHSPTIDAAFRECSLGGSKKRLLKEVNLKFKELLAKTWTLDGGGKAQKS